MLWITNLPMGIRYSLRSGARVNDEKRNPSANGGDRERMMPESVADDAARYVAQIAENNKMGFGNCATIWYWSGVAAVSAYYLRKLRHGNQRRRAYSATRAKLREIRAEAISACLRLREDECQREILNTCLMPIG